MIPIPFQQTNVLKAVIVPFRDKTMRKPVILNVFVLPVNPETYDETIKPNWDQRVAPGKEFSALRFLKSDSQNLRISFYLDGTNTIEGYLYNDVPVLAQIIQLKRAIYDIDGDSHKPFFLKFIWGTYIFDGALSNLQISYTLFNPLGIPIRAQVILGLIGHKDAVEAEAKANTNSPDLTHIKELKAGQRLDHLTGEIYNDPNLVLQVAKANQLTSFRNVKAGTELTLPPIDKRTN